jgi:hypothetical protein
MNFRTLTLLTFLLLFFGCMSKKNNLKTSHKNYSYFKSIAFQKFGADTILNLNDSNTYALCTKKVAENNMNPNVLTAFIVIQLNSNKIVFENKISSASVKWYSNNELLISKQLGIVSEQKGSGKISYIYNVETKVKKELSQTENTKY